MTGTAVEGTQTNPALAVLADALKGKLLPASRRVCAAADARVPEEGLALLSAYVTIGPVEMRQAILDVVVSLANRNARSAS